MSNKLFLFTIASSTTGVLILLMALSMPAVVYADNPVPTPNNGNCITCHEDLYFLHDTGNWFCLKESPMACVDCHGGQPGTLDRKTAHTNRAAHPIINENVTKCQQCHPDECYERVELFDKTAGISKILVAAPYTPVYSTEPIDSMTAETQQEQTPISILIYRVVIPFVLVTSLALVAYFALRKRHN